MSQVPGFHYENVDQNARITANQELVNRRVLSEYIKVISIPNTDNLNLRELVSKFLNEIVKYKNPKDEYPLTWPVSTGNNNGTSSFRAKMSNAFWESFTTDGRKRLIEFNRKNHSNIKVIRDQTISLSDLENLSLYLRKKIKIYFQSKNRTPPEVNVKNGFINIGNPAVGKSQRFRATELAVRLGWEYTDWQGTAIQKLLTNTEKRNMTENRLTWSSLDIETFSIDSGSSNQENENPVPTEVTNENGVTAESNTRKRNNTNNTTDIPAKMSKNQ